MVQAAAAAAAAYCDGKEPLMTTYCDVHRCSLEGEFCPLRKMEGEPLCRTHAAAQRKVRRCRAVGCWNFVPAVAAPARAAVATVDDGAATYNSFFCDAHRCSLTERYCPLRKARHFKSGVYEPLCYVHRNSLVRVNHKVDALARMAAQSRDR